VRPSEILHGGLPEFLFDLEVALDAARQEQEEERWKRGSS
jgi:hypothetical protein